MKEHQRPHERPDRSHFSDEELYLVAAGLVCGMAPSRIATTLGRPQPVIARMLQMAYRAGIIRLNFLPCRALERVLHEGSAGTSFHVIPDKFKPFPYREAHILGLDPVCIAVAEIARRRVEDLMADSKRNGALRIGCTGGYSLAKSVEAWAGDLLHHEPRGADRLEFVALNAAMPINNWHISSNHLVTRLSLLYSDGVRNAKHLARAGNTSRDLKKKYENLDLVLVSGGSVESSYLRDFLREKRERLPPNAIGDLGYVLLDADGLPAECSSDAKRAIAELDSALEYDDLRSYAKQGNLIVVLSEHKNVLWTQAPHDDTQFRPRHASKLPLALALMRQKLASEIVVGQTLAEDMVAALQLPIPPLDLEDIRRQLEGERRADPAEESEIAMHV